MQIQSMSSLGNVVNANVIVLNPPSTPAAPSQQVQIVKITERSCAVIGNWTPYVTILVRHKGKYKNELSLVLENSPEAVKCDAWIFPRDLKSQLEAEIMLYARNFLSTSSSTSSTSSNSTPSSHDVSSIQAANDFNVLQATPAHLTTQSHYQSSQPIQQVSQQAQVPQIPPTYVPSRKDLHARVTMLEHVVLQLQEHIQQLWLVKRG